MKIPCSTLLTVVALALSNSANAFAPEKSYLARTTSLHSLAEPATADVANDAPATRQAVRAPLRFLGPYPCLSLRFPDLATSSQRDRNVTGVSLDFVLDTAANTNTLNGLVAKELELSVVGEALPGVGAAGAIQGGQTFLLGKAELDGLDEQFTFMEGLTASALPVASAAAGLLSLPFFHCFEGGVEFQWGTGEGELPAVTFYGPGESNSALESMTRVPIKEQPITRLPTVEIMINGVPFPALLDTGSPITILNAEAAARAGINTAMALPGQDADVKKGGNPFANFANRWKEASAISQAAARGDVLTIAGSTGQPVNLIKSESKIDIGLKGADDKTVEFGDCHIYVGNIPGLAALNALGDNSPPAAVLGMDVLRLKPKMLFKAQNKEVYF